MVTAEYDRDADALYIRLSDHKVARTTEIDANRMLDLDEQGSAVGLEVLSPATNLTIAPIARRYGFDDRLPEIDDAVRATELGRTLRADPTMVYVSLVWDRPWVVQPAGAVPSTSHAAAIIPDLLVNVG
jgi:uncharacterized protein YuzE